MLWRGWGGSAMACIGNNLYRSWKSMNYHQGLFQEVIHPVLSVLQGIRQLNENLRLQYS